MMYYDNIRKGLKDDVGKRFQSQSYFFFLCMQLWTPVVNQAAVFTVVVPYGMDHTANVKNWLILDTAGQCFLEI